MAEEDTNGVLHTLPTRIWIGKAGLTSTVMEEVRKQLKKRPFVKLKILPSAQQSEGKEGIALRISREVHCSIVQQRGNTLIVKRLGEHGGDTA